MADANRETSRHTQVPYFAKDMYMSGNCYYIVAKNNTGIMDTCSCFGIFQEQTEKEKDIHDVIAFDTEAAVKVRFSDKNILTICKPSNVTEFSATTEVIHN